MFQLKYMLIEVIERDISVPEFFDAWEDAHNAMCEKVAEVKGVQVEEIKESYLSGEEYEEDTCVLEDSAWSERHGNNFDWKIFGVEENLL